MIKKKRLIKFFPLRRLCYWILKEKFMYRYFLYFLFGLTNRYRVSFMFIMTNVELLILSYIKEVR